MFLQEEAAPSFGSEVIQKAIRILNTPLIEQKGQFSVSIMSLLLLVAVIFIAALISRLARRFLEKRVLPKIHHLDSGMQYTLLRIVHYLIITIGIIYSFKLGFAIDLTSVAVIFGFLSVGIGFGLQYIASDLASGFILLFERPVRVGDRLKLGEIEGRVEAISLRSTRLVTNDDVTVIIPNSELVRKNIINWSYCDRVRIRVSVGVAYGSDVEKVTESLIEAGKSVTKVLKDPLPKVYMKGFGDSSIDFELLVWIDLPHNHPQIRSDLNYQIERIFRREKIEIPYPQRDLHIRSGAINPDRSLAAADEFDHLSAGHMETEAERAEQASKGRN